VPGRGGRRGARTHALRRSVRVSCAEAAGLWPRLWPAGCSSGARPQRPGVEFREVEAAGSLRAGMSSAVTRAVAQGRRGGETETQPGRSRGGKRLETVCVGTRGSAERTGLDETKGPGRM
jgi:hypothetical protein